MKAEVLANIQQYLDALEEIEKQGKMCSASLILHPNGSGAVEIDFLFTGTGIAVDFDTEDGHDIMESIRRLADKARNPNLHT